MWKIILLGFALFSNCLSKDIGINSLISAGSEATPHQFPFAVAVRSLNINFTPRICGGALISRQSILTAAFCVDGQMNVEVFLGAQNLAVQEPLQVRVPIASQDVRLHPDFISGQLTNDIAILRLPSPIGFFNQAINIIPLPTNAGETFLDLTATTMGWGSECSLASCPELVYLKHVDVVVRANADCQAVGLTQDSQLCASNLIGGPCNGDQGGPLVINRNGNFLLIGLTVRVGNLCRGPAVYTRITSFLPWITANM